MQRRIRLADTSFFYYGPLLNTHRAHLVDRGVALERLQDAVLHQRKHAVVQCLLMNVRDLAASLDHVLNNVVVHEQLMDSHAAAEARLGAVRATHGSVQLEIVRVGGPDAREPIGAERIHQIVVLGLVGVVRLLALLAERAEQALGENAKERIGEAERVSAWTTTRAI